MTDIDSPFMQQVFDVSQQERNAHIHRHRQTDDLERRLEVTKRIGLLIPIR